LGFVGIGCHGHLLKGIEDVVLGHSIYIPFIEGRDIVFVLAKDSWFSRYGNIWGNGCFGSLPGKSI
jgi:hypothetical protein